MNCSQIMYGRVVSVNVSAEKGVQKSPVDVIDVTADHGIDGDAHAGNWHRQISLLAHESVRKMEIKGVHVTHGGFGENITTAGAELASLPIGSAIKVGDTVVLEVSQIGKKCHSKCNIYYEAGDCIMPNEGIFAKVVSGGKIKAGDKMEITMANGAC